MKTKFYKNKYIIAIYDDEDYLIEVFDNTKEMATKLKRPRNSISRMLWNNAKVVYNRKKYKVYLIEI